MDSSKRGGGRGRGGGGGGVLLGWKEGLGGGVGGGYRVGWLGCSVGVLVRGKGC